MIEDVPLEESSFQMNVQHTSMSTIKNNDPNAYKLSSRLALRNGLEKSSDTTSLALDTTNILIAEGLNYKNYIFRVLTDSTSSATELKNYMLVVLKDSLIHQYTVTYPIRADQSIDTTNTRIEPFFGKDLLNFIPMKCGGTTSSIVWIPGYFQDVRCGSNIHSPGDSGCVLKGDDRAYLRYVAGKYTLIEEKQEPCFEDPTSGQGGGGNSPGGSQDDDDDDDDQEIEIGVLPNRGDLAQDQDPECEYLKKLLEDVTFKSRLTSLSESANSDNYEQIHEYTHEYTEDLEDIELAFHSAQGVPGGGSAPVRSLENDTLRRIIVHTHYLGLDSMFGYADIDIFLKDVLKVNGRGKDPSKMTSILAASDGSSNYVYAIKKDPNSSIANNYNTHQRVVLGMTQEEIMNEQKKYKKAIQNASSQEKMELFALKLLEKMGLHLYRTINTHTEWERLTLEPNPSDPNIPEMGTPESCD